MSLILLAGLAGYAMSNPRRRKHRRRRNPETFKWKISAAILEELHYYEVENIDTESRDGSAKEMALAIEAAGRKGPKTLTLSRAASWDLHSALDSMADIKLNGGGSERALGRATAKLRDKIAATLSETQSNPRRNPLSLDALALPAANMLWRKHGYQSPGHAEDLAMMAKRGTTAAKLWARVAQITKAWLYGGKKRSNPPTWPKYQIMPYRSAHAYEREAARRGVSEVARSSRGFMRAYERAGGWRGLSPWWIRRRDNFIKRHLTQARRHGERLWIAGKPSRRALALLMWAYKP